MAESITPSSSLLATLRSYVFLPSVPKSFTVPGFGTILFPSFSLFTEKWKELSRRTKWTIVLGGIGLGLVAHYIRRRAAGTPSTASSRRRRLRDWESRGRGGVSGRRRNPSFNSLSHSVAESSTSVAGSIYNSLGFGSRPPATRCGGGGGIGGGDGAASVVAVNVNPEQLCKMGHECLEQAVTYWEDALDLLEFLPGEGGVSGPPAIPTAAEAKLARDLQVLLERASAIASDLRENVIKPAEGLEILRKKSTTVSVSSIDHLHQLLDTASTVSAASGSRRHSETSDAESFVSAISDISLSRISTGSSQETMLPNGNADAEIVFPLYRAGIVEVDAVGVAVRKLRTKMLNCSSDRDFLAKLVGVRRAFDVLLAQDSIRSWFVSTGRNLIGDLMASADKDPSAFYNAFDDLIDYANSPDSFAKTRQELEARQVKSMNFYDVVLDFVFLDAFDDLENPPGSVVSIIQNRWLSSGFKESALQTAVFYVLKTKRHSLKFSDGFMSHFYDVSEHVTPFLAWGFLGPDLSLNRLVKHFHDHLLGFIRDSFSLHRVRYSSVDDLKSDILRIAQMRLDQVTALMESRSSSAPSTP